MTNSFTKQFNQLKFVSAKYDAESPRQKTETLIQFSKIKLPANKLLLKYFDLLLFICSHPHNKKTLLLAEHELSRISKFMRQKRNRNHEKFQNSGLPYSQTLGAFSHDLVRWMRTLKIYDTDLSYFSTDLKLNEILRLTLPSIERGNTELDLSNEELLDALLIKKENRLSFILNELEKLDAIPFIKDHLYDSLELNVIISPKSDFFSRSYNRIKTSSVFFHDEIIKYFDHEELIQRKIPVPTIPDEKKRNELILVLRNSLTLMIRETDPSTCLDVNSLRFFELERGISIAIYGMTAPRQFALESYVGYTLFKNRFPAAYGGGWVFGRRAKFGINIFEPFRGGESGYLMCQLLRVYSQVFNISYFEVDPYQYGKNNPEGISSGAYWFYYRFGFRSMDKKLFRLANAERENFKKNKNYRSSKKILLKFTESKIALNLENKIPPSLNSYADKISAMIEHKFQGDRKLAVEKCKSKLLRKTDFKESDFNANEIQSLEEFSLLAEVIKPNAENLNELYVKLIRSKPIDLYIYQKNLIDFFEKIKK